MTIYNMYDEVATLMAGLDADKLTALKATPAMQQRFKQLASQSKQALISSQDKDELDHYIVLERLIRLAKLRAIA